MPSAVNVSERRSQAELKAFAVSSLLIVNMYILAGIFRVQLAVLLGPNLYLGAGLIVCSMLFLGVLSFIISFRILYKS
ncbi:MAG: hypothetical protein G01um101418_852 [Parcubacteria group bacterium Gr01-1014_18]|nr:MAG: hypothetical protein Greene041636_812 [Parcubacteria group bacterium Greene0416_36]TSC79853.1 MAG: hypothetical protein G01um101418_852 [Parcubacteria group bacterium Gr01-1014_18]TSC98285.1 MAG: hypothetical protein Greene101420_789 [Parcubacteria group bacterium Greene1014_20]TSD06675.1 MAG: hypothetical protein Greene07142_727 [Parcubacteria group bacterium Greene0714_2]